MKTLQTIATLGIGLLFWAAPFSVAAADLPHSEWCTAGEPLEVATLSVLREAVVPRRPPGDPVCPDGDADRGDCGQFDDDYRNRGMQMAGMGCTGFGQASALGGDFGRTMFLADPGSGWPITGSCVRCEARLPPPLR